jgi:bisphosphoglycerate-dependent phosphoglycerate mutase
MAQATTSSARLWLRAALALALLEGRRASVATTTTRVHTSAIARGRHAQLPPPRASPLATAARGDQAADATQSEGVVVFLRHGESEWNLANRFTGAHARRAPARRAPSPLWGLAGSESWARRAPGEALGRCAPAARRLRAGRFGSLGWTRSGWLPRGCLSVRPAWLLAPFFKRASSLRLPSCVALTAPLAPARPLLTPTPTLATAATRHAGWTDVALSPRGEEEAAAAGELLAASGLVFDKVNRAARVAARRPRPARRLELARDGRSRALRVQRAMRLVCTGGTGSHARGERSGGRSRRAGASPLRGLGSLSPCYAVTLLRGCVVTRLRCCVVLGAMAWRCGGAEAMATPAATHHAPLASHASSPRHAALLCDRRYVTQVYTSLLQRTTRTAELVMPRLQPDWTLARAEAADSEVAVAAAAAGRARAHSVMSSSMAAVSMAAVSMAAADATSAGARPCTPLERSWRLNERMYGALEGLNKRDVCDLYGITQFQNWVRDPPPLTPASPHFPGNDARCGGRRARVAAASRRVLRCGGSCGCRRQRRLPAASVSVPVAVASRDD